MGWTLGYEGQTRRLSIGARSGLRGSAGWRKCAPSASDGGYGKFARSASEARMSALASLGSVVANLPQPIPQGWKGHVVGPNPRTGQPRRPEPPRPSPATSSVRTPARQPRRRHRVQPRRRPEPPRPKWLSSVRTPAARSGCRRFEVAVVGSKWLSSRSC
jgi:hypothetical protein